MNDYRFEEDLIDPKMNRDDGYDVTDYYSVDHRLGTLGDFTDLLHQAESRACG